MRWLVLLLLAFVSCRKSYTPKPKGYNRLTLPDTVYQASPDSLPYSFVYSKHAYIRPYRSRIAEKNWIEIVYPSLDSYLHITYKKINDKKALQEYIRDAFELTSKQQIKAYAIDEVQVKTRTGKTAFISEISGDVPTQMQFTLTDSTRHFLRGALYFQARVNNDSLAPAIEFMKKETIHFIHSLRWKEK